MYPNLVKVRVYARALVNLENQFSIRKMMEYEIGEKRARFWKGSGTNELTNGGLVSLLLFLLYIYLFIINPEGPMIRQISKVVGLQIVRYCYHVSDATLTRQADRFVAVIISWCRPSTTEVDEMFLLLSLSFVISITIDIVVVIVFVIVVIINNIIIIIVVVRRAVLALGQRAGPPYQPGRLPMDTPFPLNEPVLRTADHRGWPIPLLPTGKPSRGATLRHHHHHRRRQHFHYHLYL